MSLGLTQIKGSASVVTETMQLPSKRRFSSFDDEKSGLVTDNSKLIHGHGHGHSHDHGHGHGHEHGIYERDTHLVAGNAKAKVTTAHMVHASHHNMERKSVLELDPMDPRSISEIDTITSGSVIDINLEDIDYPLVRNHSRMFDDFRTIGSKRKRKLFGRKSQNRGRLSGFPTIERHINPLWCPNVLCNLVLDDIQSNFIYITVAMDTSELTLDQRKFLPLFAQALLEAPFVDNGLNYHPFERLVTGLDKDLVKYNSFFGLDWDPELDCNRFQTGCFSHLFCIRFQIHLKKIKQGFEWMQTLLWNTKWTSDRIRNLALRLQDEAKDLHDDPRVMAKAVLAENLYRSNSNVRAISLVRQRAFLERVSEDLPKSFKGIARHLENIRLVVLRPENTTVHIASNLSRMDFYLRDVPEIRDAISQLLTHTFDYTGWVWDYPTKRLANEPDTTWMKSLACINKCVPEYLLRIPSTETAFLIQAAPCIRRYTCPEYPILLVTMHYFTQPGGPFYWAVRAKGYAQNYKMELKPEEGLIYFEILAATNLVAAYTSVVEIISRHCDAATPPPKKVPEPEKKEWCGEECWGEEEDEDFEPFEMPEEEDEKKMSIPIMKVDEGWGESGGPAIRPPTFFPEPEDDSERVDVPLAYIPLPKTVPSFGKNPFKGEAEDGWFPPCLGECEGEGGPFYLWSEDILESAKSSAISYLLEKESTPKELGLTSLLDYYRDLPPHFSRLVMKRIKKVTLQEVFISTRRYLRALLINTTTCVVTAPPDDAIRIVQGLMDNCGKRLSLFPPVHMSDMASFV